MSRFFSRIQGLFGIRLAAGRQSDDYDRPFVATPSEPEVSTIERHQAIASARELVLNDATAAGLANRLSFAVVGSGIRPSLASSDDVWNRVVEEWWADWSAAPDRVGIKSLCEIAHRAVSALLTDGGLGLRLCPDGLVEIVELDRLWGGDHTTPPYVLDEGGRLTHWLVAPRTQSGLGKPEAIPVSEFLLVSNTVRADQIVPTPILAPVVNDLRNLSELQRLSMRSYKVQSTIAATFERSDGGLGLAHAVNGKSASIAASSKDKITKFAAHTGLSILDAKGKLTPLQITAPGANYESFTSLAIKRVAMAVGVPYEFLTLFFGQSYSASRATLTQAHSTIRVWQDKLIASILKPLFLWRVQMAIADRELPALPSAESSLSAVLAWQRPAFDWIDPSDATQSDLAQIRAGLITASEAVEKRGNQLDTVLERRAQELSMIREIANRHGLDPSELSTIVIAGDTTVGAAKE